MFFSCLVHVGKSHRIPAMTNVMFFFLCLFSLLSLSDPTEKVSLQVVSQSPIREGDNVTLKCQADGNPPPTSFNFNIKVRDRRPCPQQPRQSFISRVLLSVLYPFLQVNYTISLSLLPSSGQEGHSDGQGCLHSDWRYSRRQWRVQVLPS